MIASSTQHLVPAGSRWSGLGSSNRTPIVPLAASTTGSTTVTVAFGVGWASGLLVGVGGAHGPAASAAIGTPLGYRLVFGFLSLMVLGALAIYRQAPDRPDPDRPRTPVHGRPMATGQGANPAR